MSNIQEQKLELIKNTKNEIINIPKRECKVCKAREKDSQVDDMRIAGFSYREIIEYIKETQGIEIDKSQMSRCFRSHESRLINKIQALSKKDEIKMKAIEEVQNGLVIDRASVGLSQIRQATELLLLNALDGGLSSEFDTNIIRLFDICVRATAAYENLNVKLTKELGNNVGNLEDLSLEELQSRIGDALDRKSKFSESEIKNYFIQNNYIQDGVSKQKEEDFINMESDK